MSKLDFGPTMIKKIVISLMALFIVAMIALSFYGNAAKAIDGQLKLLMFHSKTCSFCKAFMKEVAYDYDNKELPLIIIDAHNQPDWFKEAMKENRIKPIYGTPTFIIWNGRKELTRLIGYYNREKFYERLKGIYAKNNN